MNIAGSEVKVRKPVCTFLILVLTVGTFLLTKNIAEELYSMGTVIGIAVFEKGEIYRLLTGMFLHADVGHIVANMLLFFCLGGILEEEFGIWKMMAMYFVPGVIGNFISALYYFGKHSFVSSVGASAGIYGLLGVVIILCMVNHGEFHNVTMPKVMLFFIISIFEGYLTMNIDIVAHIAGLIMGIIIGLVIAFPKDRKSFV